MPPAHGVSYQYTGVCVCVCENKIQRRRILGQRGFQSTKSVAGAQFLLKDCKAKVREKGALFSYTHTDISREQHQRVLRG